MNRIDVPWWIILIIVVLMLPVVQMPALLANCPAEVPMVKTLVWVYPVYVLVAGWLAYICYDRRRLMSFILMALMILTHIAVWLLVTSEL